LKETKRRRERARRTCGRLHDQFVNSEASTASLGDSGAGSLREAQRCNLELGDVQNSHIIRHGADDNHSAVLLLAQVLDDLAQRDGRSHRSGGDKSSQDGFAEAGSRSPREELEELHKEKA